MVSKTGIYVRQCIVLGLVLFIILSVAQSLRTSFTLVLTQMVLVPNKEPNNSTSGELICPVKNSNPSNDTTKPDVDDSNRYDWSQSVQGLIISSYFIGNVVSEIPSGILVPKYGAKLLMSIGVFSSTIIMALTPLGVHAGGANGLIVSRVFVGFFQGPLIACSSSLLIAWFPIEERGRASLGTFLFSYLVSVIIEETKGWDMVFYVLAVISGIGGVLFLILCYNDPQSHPFINEREKTYLLSDISKYATADRKLKPPIPWRAICTNIPIIAVLAAGLLYNWDHAAINNSFPKYANDVLHLSLKKNAIFTALQKILTMCVGVVAAILNDWLYTKDLIRLTTLRKCFFLLSTIIPEALGVWASYGGCDETLLIILMTLIISFGGFAGVGINISMYDLAPNYTAPLNAILHTVCNVAFFVASYSVGLLTPHAYLSEWRLIFWLGFGAYILSAAIFTIWGSAEVQSFNTPQTTKPNSKKIPSI